MQSTICLFLFSRAVLILSFDTPRFNPSRSTPYHHNEDFHLPSHSPLSLLRGSSSSAFRGPGTCSRRRHRECMRLSRKRLSTRRSGFSNFDVLFIAVAEPSSLHKDRRRQSSAVVGSSAHPVWNTSIATKGEEVLPQPIFPSHVCTPCEAVGTTRCRSCSFHCTQGAFGNLEKNRTLGDRYVLMSS